jgi:aspartate kinase
VRPGRILEAVGDGAIAIVAGFQGVSQTTKDITTLGRGGSDTTAVALAVALEADVCEIYSDVDGIFTADPRIEPRARKIPRISYEETLEMAAQGAKILHLRCVEYARRYDMPIHVRSSFSEKEGTWVVKAENVAQESTMESAIITGVAHDRSQAKITVVGVPDKVGEAAAIFRAIADAQINIDMIVQNVSEAGRATITFTLPEDELRRAEPVLEQLKSDLGASEVIPDTDVAKVSLVGAGMRSNPGIAADMFDALAEAGINIEIISTSSIRVSCVIRASEVERAVRAVHDRFQSYAEERVNG